jgi:DUF4097 and DUF4098 domain-containing protein YvlB
MGIETVVLAVLLAHSGEDSQGSRRATAPDARIEIQNRTGSVTVMGWEQNEVALSDDQGLEMEGTDRWIKITAKHRRHDEDSDVTIRVPAGAQIEVHGHSSDVKVSGVRGSVTVGVVSGNITVTGPTQAADLTTVSGDVHLDAPSKKTHTESVSGDVTVRGVQGDLRASTVNGELDVQGKAFGEVHLETVSGDLKFLGDLSPQGKASAETVSGDIELAFPPAIDADFEASSFSGEIKNGFGSAVRGPSRFQSGKKVSFTVGKGGAQVQVKTMSGSIEIKSQKGQEAR